MNGSRIILFLDFDGVLHPRVPAAGSEMFRALPLLNEALEEFQNLRIVVTSSWRDHPKDLAWALGLFPSELRQRVLGCTPQIGGKGEREREILAWLRDCVEERPAVAVLDDEPELFSGLRTSLFSVSGTTGLVREDICRLRAWLLQRSGRAVL
jgi:hypothetical protein